MARGALFVCDIYFEDAKWQALSLAVTLKVFRLSPSALNISINGPKTLGIQKRHKSRVHFTS
jgi:hypothetical protein